MIIDPRVKNLITQTNLYIGDSIQEIQLNHRYRLVDTFGLAVGMRILEIGCGQGDSSVVLADIVGPTGHVTAIDLGSPAYGAPVSLGEATKRIKSSPIGKSIDFQLETEFLDFVVPQDYDAVVLSHCSWYFKSEDELLAYLIKIKTISAKLCFAEWDININNSSQIAHYNAAILAAIYSQQVTNEGNIQSLFSPQAIQTLLARANFSEQTFFSISSDYLQDGQWEVDFVNAIYPDLKNSTTWNPVLCQSLLETMNVQKTVKSLDSFVIVAR